MKPTRPDRRRLALLAGAALATLPLRPVAAGVLRGAAPLQALEGQAFATGWRVLLPASADAQALGPAIADTLDRIDREMSPWRADSAVSRFNRAQAGAHPLPQAVLSVTADALAIAAASGGSFDPTVGPLVSRWGFGPISGTEAPGWQTLSIRGARLAKSVPGATLDLCGIAKGHALDRIAAILRDAGVDHALVEVGGELLGIGAHPEGRDWQAGVEDPRPGVPGLAARVPLAGQAVATSGSRWNGYDLGGRRVSHIIDPATAAPVEGGLASVSVLAPTGALADGWATALMAAGAERGVALARAGTLSALFLIVEGARLRPVVTGGATWS